MPQSREDRIYLAYKANNKSLRKQGLVDRVHARALLFVAGKFDISPIYVQQIVNARRDDNVKKSKK